MYGLNYGYKTSVSKLMVNHLKKRLKIEDLEYLIKISNFRYWFK